MRGPNPLYQKEVIKRVSTAHPHLIKWGKDAFERGYSLENIENYLIKRGMRKHEALQALHEITSFEHKIHQEAENIRRELISIPILLIIILFGLIFLYLFGVFKVK